MTGRPWAGVSIQIDERWWIQRQRVARAKEADISSAR